MKKNSFILRAAVAAACGLGASSAMAVGVFTGPAFPVNYAAEAITAASSLTVPATAGVYSVAAGAKIGTGALLTFTLNGGATFAGTPPSLVANGGCTAGGAIALQSSTSTTVTYTVTGTLTSVAPAVCTLNLGNFTVSNVSFLSTPATVAGANKLTMSVSGSLNVGDDPLPTGAAATATQLTGSSSALLFGSAGNTQLIDIATGGKNFVPSTVAGAGPNTTATIAQLGTFFPVAAGPAPLLNDGITPIIPASATLALTGNFNNISSVFADTTTCDKAGTGNRVSATPTATGATLTGLKVTVAYNICAVANGTGVLWGLNNSINASASVSYTNAAGTTALGAAGSPLGTFVPGAAGTNYAALRYNGQAGNMAYVVGGAVGGYASFLRAGNNTGASQQLYATVQTDGGSVFTGPLGSLGANAAKLITASDLNTATGSSLSSATDRANVWVFMTGPSASFGNIILNPNATVSAMP